MSPRSLRKKMNIPDLRPLLASRDPELVNVNGEGPGVYTPPVEFFVIDGHRVERHQSSVRAQSPLFLYCQEVRLSS